MWHVRRWCFLSDDESEGSALVCAERSADGCVREYLEKSDVQVREYDAIYEDVSLLPAGARLLYDENHVNDALVRRISPEVEAFDGENPTLLLKAVKNPVEVENERAAHVRDGVAVTRFIYWLKKHAGKEPVTELSAAVRLEELREEQEDYIGPSFYPILAYGEHGAIVHYSADEQSDVLLRPEGFLLADTEDIIKRELRTLREPSRLDRSRMSRRKCTPWC